MAKKQYAQIEGYGRLMVPLNLLEKIAAEGYVVETGYGDNNEISITKVEKISGVKLWTQDDVDAAIVQQKLEESK
jgi:hypothetical protein